MPTDDLPATQAQPVPDDHAAPEASPAPSRRRSSLGVRFGLAFMLGVVTILGVGGGALYAYEQQYTGKVLPGVHVGKVDLSGLSPAQARRAIEDAYASLGAGRIALTGPSGEMTIGYGEIGRRADVDAMLAAALDAGRRGDRVADLIGGPQTALRGLTIAPIVTYDPARLAQAVAAVAAGVNLSPVDATLTPSEDGTFRMTTSVDGRHLDEQALVDAIVGRIAAVDAPAEVALDLPIATVHPTIDTPDAIAGRAAGERLSADITLRHGDETWAIAGSKIRSLVRFHPTVDGSIVPVVDIAGLDPLIAAIAKDVDQAPKSATYLVGKGEKIVGVQAGRNGRTLDPVATRALIVDALMVRLGGGSAPEVTPAVAVTEPTLTTEEAEKAAPLMQEIARWTTPFPIGEKNGFGANIWIPAGIINGFVVAPGETFDFWKAVGPVTREKGYRDGGAIINGKTEPQGALAGGICSCSTTLFNAALRAGMKMGSRRNHYYYIDRYPLGLDATVFISASGSKQTMSWTNDTKYPVLVRGINTRKGTTGYVTFVIYSVPTGRTVVIGDPVVKNVRPASDSVQYTSTLKAGVRKRIEYPVAGKDVWRTVTVYEDGRMLRQVTYYSHYSRITGIVLVGTGGTTPGATPTPAPTDPPPPAPSTTP